MRLARFAVVSGLLVSVFASALAVASLWQGTLATQHNRAMIDRSVEQLQDSARLAQATADIKFDVVQVQQWLTDISATRGLDGLNDGFDKAAGYADDFTGNIEDARGLATDLNDAEMIAALDGVQQAFAPYYDTGKRMAQAYIDGGPESGNVLMGEFDATAEAISTELDKLQGATQAYADQVEADRRHVAELIAAGEAQQVVAQGATFAILVLFIVAMTLFVSMYVLRRLKAISAQLLVVAEGDYSRPVYGSRSWDELKNIAAAAEVFRQNGLRLAEMSAEEIAQTTARRQERAAMMQSLQDAFGQVVEAAVEGDFGRRVPANFQDDVLNRLAGSVNTLVETIDAGLAETAVVLSGLARYQLGHRMTGTYRGAFARLQDDTNAVAENLESVVGQLRVSSQALRSATSEILAGANDLADRTSRSAASVEETAAAIEQLSQTVLDNAQRAESVVKTVRTVNQTAERTGAVMHEAEDAMARITASSGRISNIIGLIDDIAFQTNLLALNASVEAARAGDAGKGFAVVAIEVRRLAQSAASASADVKVLIEESSVEVNAGTRFVAEAAENLGTVLADMRTSSQLVTSIAQASKEQAVTIGELSGAVRQVDEMTQHNAALVEQTNAAIEQTERQVAELDRIVDVFSSSADNPATSRRAA